MYPRRSRKGGAAQPTTGSGHATGDADDPCSMDAHVDACAVRGAVVGSTEPASPALAGSVRRGSSSCNARRANGAVAPQLSPTAVAIPAAGAVVTSSAGAPGSPISVSIRRGGGGGGNTGTNARTTCVNASSAMYASLDPSSSASTSQQPHQQQLRQPHHYAYAHAREGSYMGSCGDSTGYPTAARSPPMPSYHATAGGSAPCPTPHSSQQYPQQHQPLSSPHGSWSAQAATPSTYAYPSQPPPPQQPLPSYACDKDINGSANYAGYPLSQRWGSFSLDSAPPPYGSGRVSNDGGYLYPPPPSYGHHVASHMTAPPPHSLQQPPQLQHQHGWPGSHDGAQTGPGSPHAPPGNMAISREASSHTTAERPAAVAKAGTAPSTLTGVGAGAGVVEVDSDIRASVPQAVDARYAHLYEEFTKANRSRSRLAQENEALKRDMQNMVTELSYFRSWAAKLAQDLANLRSSYGQDVLLLLFIMDALLVRQAPGMEGPRGKAAVLEGVLREEQGRHMANSSGAHGGGDSALSIAPDTSSMRQQQHQHEFPRWVARALRLRIESEGVFATATGSTLVDSTDSSAVAAAAAAAAAVPEGEAASADGAGGNSAATASGDSHGHESLAPLVGSSRSKNNNDSSSNSSALPPGAASGDVAATGETALLVHEEMANLIASTHRELQLFLAAMDYCAPPPLLAAASPLESLSEPLFIHATTATPSAADGACGASTTVPEGQPTTRLRSACSTGSSDSRGGSSRYGGGMRGGGTIQLTLEVPASALHANVTDRLLQTHSRYTSSATQRHIITTEGGCVNGSPGGDGCRFAVASGEKIGPAGAPLDAPPLHQHQQQWSQPSLSSQRQRQNSGWCCNTPSAASVRSATDSLGGGLGPGVITTSVPPSYSVATSAAPPLLRPVVSNHSSHTTSMQQLSPPPPLPSPPPLYENSVVADQPSYLINVSGRLEGSHDGHEAEIHRSEDSSPAPQSTPVTGGEVKPSKAAAPLCRENKPTTVRRTSTQSSDQEEE